MDHRDLDRYVAAKKQHRLALSITILGLVLFLGAAGLLLLGVTGPVVTGVLGGSVLGVQFVLYGVAASRKVLLDIIENQINRDPDALAYLAKKS